MSALFCPHFSIALTGGIASGKTTVSEQLAQLGARVVDTDVIAHALTASTGGAIAAIAVEFGPHLLAADGSLNRQAMRELVFSNASARKALEGILHPFIYAEAQAMGCTPLSADESYVVFVVPLLVGLDGDATRWRTRVQRIVTVDCAPELQMVRLMARAGLSLDAAQSIINAQANREQRLACADDVIGNDGDHFALNAQVQRLHAQYAQMSLDFRASAPQAQG